MKKRLLLACFLALPLYIVAQTSFGIKAGPNYTAVRDHISPSNAPEMVATEGILGFHGGIFRQKSISDALYLQFEFLYNIKGSKVTFANTASNQRFHYLSLPALISWEIFTSIYLSGGLELNYLLSADAPGNFQVLDKDRKFDLSALFGIAFDFNEHWMADVRYTHGLLPLSNIAVFDQVITPEAEYKWYNQTLQLALQYKF